MSDPPDHLETHENCQHKNNKVPVAMPYSEIPEDVLEDPSELALWARDAFDAALRAKQAKAK